MKQLIFILLFSFCFADMDATIARKDAMVKDAAKAEVIQNVYDTNIGQSQSINWQWQAMAKEAKQENLILRSVCLGLIAGSISYVGAGQLCALAVSGGVGYLSYTWINK